MTDTELTEKWITGAPLLIITGLSGAGKSTAMRFLEDLGCYCLDNLPPSLIPDFFELYQKSGSKSSGVVIASDVRSGALFEDFAEMVTSLQSLEVSYKILFLDCSNETLVTRFKEVRRNHPLKANLPMTTAIEEERRRLKPIRALATTIVDTSDMKAADLREAIIRDVVSEESANVVTFDCISFGFKHGVPPDVDYVFDARFLPNPFYVPELRSKTGEDQDVYDFVMSDPLADKYFQKITELIEMTLKSFVKVGKTSITLGVGCTGGKHRSVAFTCRLARYFESMGRTARIIHRDKSKL